MKLFLIMIAASSCKSPAPLLFDPLQYSADDYYIGMGIAKDSDRGQARQAAKISAVSDLASLMQTTISSTKTASFSDTGTKQTSLYEELIEETLYQEFENVIYIEETYTANHEQTTYAIISRADWEAQKARKILRENEKAHSILSSRYPDMSPVLEIQILNTAVSSLQSTL